MINHIATIIFMMCSGTTANDPHQYHIPKSIPSNLELGIAAILDLVIITIITIVYWRTPCAIQTRQACIQYLRLSTKTPAFALPIVAPVASTSIASVISQEKQSIAEML